MKVRCEMQVSELDGEPCGGVVVAVESHPSFATLAVLVVGDHRYTVEVCEFTRALENAGNVR